MNCDVAILRKPSSDCRCVHANDESHDGGMPCDCELISVPLRAVPSMIAAAWANAFNQAERERPYGFRAELRNGGE